MIKAIVFDYMDVIAPSPIKKLLNKYYPNDLNRFDLLKKYSQKWDLGEIDLETFYKVLSEITSTPVESVWDVFYENLFPDERVINIIKKLKQDYKIILFSNNHGDHLRRMLKHQAIDTLFDEIIISSDHKMIKPSKEFFDLMLSIGKIDASEAIFIDDQQINVDAANSYGIKSFQFIDAETLKKDLL